MNYLNWQDFFRENGDLNIRAVRNYITPEYFTVEELYQAILQRLQFDLNPKPHNDLD